MPPWTAAAPIGPAVPTPLPGSHNSQGILGMRSGMSPGTAVVPARAGALWGSGGCPIFPPCWLGADSWDGRLTSGDDPSVPGPLPHLPSSSGPRVCLGREASWGGQVRGL